MTRHSKRNFKRAKIISVSLRIVFFFICVMKLWPGVFISAGCREAVH